MTATWSDRNTRVAELLGGDAVAHDWLVLVTKVGGGSVETGNGSVEMQPFCSRATTLHGVLTDYPNGVSFLTGVKAGDNS
jgi:hypothetical protein